MANVTITTAGKENLNEYKNEAAQRLAVIFKDDPVIRYMLCSLSPPARHAYMTQYFQTLMRAAQLSQAIFQEANAWSCIAVWLPPNRHLDAPLTVLRAGFIPCVLKLGLGGAKRMLLDFQAQSDGLKKRHLYAKGIREFWYLFFIGTEERARGQGLAGGVVREWQKRAQKENLPIWLEATTEKSKRVYEKCGFEFLEEIVMGVGTHNADGEREKGGSGVKMWAMMWKPETAVESKENENENRA